MFKVNIYIETSIHGPSRRDGAYMYLVEFVKRDGTPVTRHAMNTIESATELQLTLTAMIESIGILNKDCEITIFTRCQTIINATSCAWHVIWEKNGWRNAKGNPVKCAELWQQYIDISRQHSVQIVNKEHSYRNWMKNQLKPA